jgi:hypothetical protein
MLRKGNGFAVVHARKENAASFGATSMRLVLVATAVVALLFCTHHASAFSMDSSSGTSADGSPRYVDPDDQIRSIVGGKDDDSHDLGYDANARHPRQPAQEIINGQGVLVPGFFSPTAPSRR